MNSVQREIHVLMVIGLVMVVGRRTLNHRIHAVVIVIGSGDPALRP